MQLTEPQAWRVIRDAYATPRSERTSGWQRYIGLVGIVGTLTTMNKNKRIPWRQFNTMRSAYQHDTGHYYLSYDPANDLLRADYCELQAVIAKSGGV